MILNLLYWKRTDPILQGRNSALMPGGYNWVDVRDVCAAPSMPLNQVFRFVLPAWRKLAEPEKPGTGDSQTGGHKPLARNTCLDATWSAVIKPPCQNDKERTLIYRCLTSYFIQQPQKYIH